jgi:hypothetical protein
MTDKGKFNGISLEDRCSPISPNYLSYSLTKILISAEIKMGDEFSIAPFAELKDAMNRSSCELSSSMDY